MALALRAARGAVRGDASVDGPLAFDNAISAAAAKEKGIVSEVAGVIVGLAAPVVLSSRADPPPARLAALALASLMHHRGAKRAAIKTVAPETSLHCAPQPEHACCPMTE